MDLVSVIRRAVSTSAFRAAAVAVAAYLVCAGLVVGLLLWQTNRILTDQVLATLGTEAELLRAEARAGDTAALMRAVEARSVPGSAGLYFLADASGAKLAGNLNRMPPEIGAAGGVPARPISASPSPSSSAPACASSSGAMWRRSAASPTRCARSISSRSASCR